MAGYADHSLYCCGQMSAVGGVDSTITQAETFGELHNLHAAGIEI